MWNSNGWLSKCGNRVSGANFYIAFHSNYGSILFLRYDHRTDDDWRRQASHLCRVPSQSHKWNAVTFPDNVQNYCPKFSWLWSKLFGDPCQMQRLLLWYVILVGSFPTHITAQIIWSFHPATENDQSSRIWIHITKKSCLLTQGSHFLIIRISWKIIIKFLTNPVDRTTNQTRQKQNIFSRDNNAN